MHTRETRTGAAVAAALLVAYVVTLAPTVTYWDAGEFLAAIRTLGIPHPPGTPLYILAGNVWAKALTPVLGFAYSINLLSAVSTAAACGIFATLFHRWTRDPVASVAGGLLAGLMSSVWLNANETEVYSPALLMSALLLLAADNSRNSREERWLVLIGYLLGLSWSLQLSALVIAPAALVLAALSIRGRRIPAFGMIAAAMLGATATLFMLVRAKHDPGINQGNPATWSTFIDVVTRKQYMPASLLPRQAPFYIQVGNLFEYADWQVALGLHNEAPPAPVRTIFTIAYASLGVIGSLWHRRAERATWRVMMFLFVCATLGVIVYLNMKASPSYGWGVLPPAAKHEARERDYFFALAFVCWGLWAGAGAVAAFRKLSPRAGAAGLIVAALPFALNFKATDRARAPESHAARDSAKRILVPAPRRAVVFAYGDNDTYPVWYAQNVEGLRTDVVTVTIPLLGAEWYRAELERRHGLLSDDYVEAWRGFGRTMRAICESAAGQGRPVIAAKVRDRPEIPSQCFH